MGPNAAGGLTYKAKKGVCNTPLLKNLIPLDKNHNMLCRRSTSTAMPCPYLFGFLNLPSSFSAASIAESRPSRTFCSIEGSDCWILGSPKNERYKNSSISAANHCRACCLRRIACRTNPWIAPRCRYSLRVSIRAVAAIDAAPATDAVTSLRQV